MKKQFIIMSIVCALTSNCFAQTETKISRDSLPSTIHAELHKKYAAYAVNSVLAITDNVQNITYKIELQKRSTVIDLLYDKDGKLVSKEKSKSFSYDGTEKTRQKSTPSQSNDGHSGHQH